MIGVGMQAEKIAQPSRKDLTAQMREQKRSELKEYGGAGEDPSNGQPEQEKYRDNIKSGAEGFAFTHVSQLLRDIKPTDWLIHGYLEAEALSVLFGESGTLKTFLALSWGLSISCGIDWFGHKVKQGPVFFIIGEGQNGFARRVKAWEIEMGVDLSDKPFFVSNTPVMMLDVMSAKAAGDAINKLREKHGTPALVVIDTLARNFGPGDENSTADMTNFISNLDEYIGRDFSRMVVHHTGQGNKERARGSYALLAAVDSEYCMAKNKVGIVLSCTKMKDSAKFSEVAFKPRTVTINNDYQHPMTSLVLDLVRKNFSEALDMLIAYLEKAGGSLNKRELLDRAGGKEIRNDIKNKFSINKNIFSNLVDFGIESSRLTEIKNAVDNGRNTELIISVRRVSVKN